MLTTPTSPRHPGVDASDNLCDLCLVVVPCVLPTRTGESTWEVPPGYEKAGQGESPDQQPSVSEEGAVESAFFEDPAYQGQGYDEAGRGDGSQDPSDYEKVLQEDAWLYPTGYGEADQEGYSQPPQAASQEDGTSDYDGGVVQEETTMGTGEE